MKRTMMSDEQKIIPGQNGGWRPGTGRPKGSKNIKSHDSVGKLAELEFDPIEKLVDSYHDLNRRIKEIEQGARPSQMAIAQLVSVRERVVNNLLKYGYRPVPERTEQVVEEVKPINIILTKTKAE